MERIITSSEKLNYSILRFGIIYGKKTSNYSAVESIVEQVKNKSVITVQSKKTSRSFIHIDDIISAVNPPKECPNNSIVLYSSIIFSIR